jgi:hypothetical protein
MLIESSNKIRDKNPKENCGCRGDDDEGEEETSAPKVLSRRMGSVFLRTSGSFILKRTSGSRSTKTQQAKIN